MGDVESLGQLGKPARAPESSAGRAGASGSSGQLLMAQESSRGLWRAKASVGHRQASRIMQVGALQNRSL
eukprot:11257045-Alexandrium_andersonii.AAC.1